MKSQSRPWRREVVGIFSSRAAFDQAVNALLREEFVRSDLSVLSAHDGLDAASPEQKSWRDRLVALLGELKYEGPLVTAGLIALAAGPVGAIIAGIIAAGVGGAALKELMDDLTARPHSAEFARALAAGAILLWVDADTDGREIKAKDVLVACGGANVHTNERSA